MTYIRAINIRFPHYHILYFIYYVKWQATWRHRCRMIALLKTSLLLAWVLLAFNTQAQTTSNIHYNSFLLEGDTLQLDTMSVVPNTVVIRLADGTVIDTNDYTIRAFQSQLIWNKKPAVDSVKIFYRTYPFNLSAQASH